MRQDTEKFKAKLRALIGFAFPGCDLRLLGTQDNKIQVYLFHESFEGKKPATRSGMFDKVGLSKKDLSRIYAVELYSTSEYVFTHKKTEKP